MDAAGVVRPRFDIHVEMDVHEVLTGIRRYFDQHHFGCRGWVAPPYAEFEVQAATQRVWSPRLAIFACEEPTGCTLHCRFQPAPSVWTLYMAAWAIVIVTGALAVAWTCAMMIMGRAELMPIATVVFVAVTALVLYLSSLVGQRMGADQMQVLRDALDDVLRDSVGAPRYVMTTASGRQLAQVLRVDAEDVADTPSAQADERSAPMTR